MNRFRSMLTKEVLRETVGFMAFLVTAIALLLVFLTSGCDDGPNKDQPEQSDMPRPSCTEGDLTRYLVEVQEVRQRCTITKLDERLCEPGVPSPMAGGRIGQMFEVTVAGRLLISRIQTRVPGVTTIVGNPYKVTSDRRFTATVVAADNALFYRAKVGDTLTLCPWQDQKYGYELPDSGILQELDRLKPSNDPLAEQESPACDQPPCPTEGEGEGTATVLPFKHSPDPVGPR